MSWLSWAQAFTVWRKWRLVPERFWCRMASSLSVARSDTNGVNLSVISLGTLSGVGGSGIWRPKDLKDHMRAAGEVSFADAHKQRTGEGVVEFTNMSDMKYALDKLDGTEINGKKIRLSEDRPRTSSKRSYTRSRSRSKSSTPSKRSSRSRSKSSESRRSSSKSRSPDDK